MTVAPHMLRRYIVDRASGRMPRSEWTYYAPEAAAWIRADERTARRHEHHRRVRIDGLAWCDVLGHRTVVADDAALQAYFLTITPDDWQRLAIDVSEHPTRCLREWRAAGALILATVDPETEASGGPLSDWPTSRGTGPRSLLTR
ncbi:hypothetical protein BJ123_13017 [Rhodopseudomonas thermotolerans]|uniref:Uncharacterized protein n=2 Tax=Rhodopseudomonas TaxID=1073 RepID=A0A336JUG3_9BRAD|nr:MULTISPECIES: hypothetical protein [Rhodopseudomonas]RED25784.1 hypothetical protein BJ125_13017 [Rhodopseudomonas pentothenatexigens]REF90413.1 hypothetical protein BJ123_13017 [Rhodopseudomonas thermotolerans]SSW93112.1 hypothetical protein SAMN05892882_13017 [Rhodopseudomonas pentothenatexigens]